MVATNSVRVRTGNVSAGTSIFAMVVLEHKLARLHPEVDLVTTPAGDLAGMSHANNFTSDLNAWVGLFGQFAAAIGQPVDAGTLYGTLFRAAIADDVDADCGGLLNYPFRSGEFLAGLPEGRPLFARSPEARMSLGNFMRTQLFSAFSPVKIGMDVMKNTPSEMFANAIISGWLIATMVWMFPAAGAAKIVVIILMTWLIALGDTTHIVVGSVEILYLVFNGTLHWSDFIWPFALPTLAGNICGGTFIFALMSHAQIRNDMSNKRKAEARQKAERAENIKKNDKNPA